MFHDGTKMTGEDIKFTFDRLTQDGAMDGQTSPRKDLVGPREGDRAGRSLHGALRAEGAMADPAGHAPVPGGGQQGVRAEGRRPAASPRRSTARVRSSWSSGARATRSSWSASTTITAARRPSRRSARPASTAWCSRSIPENASRIAALLAGEVDIAAELPASDMKQHRGEPERARS